MSSKPLTAADAAQLAEQALLNTAESINEELNELVRTNASAGKRQVAKYVAKNSVSVETLNQVKADQTNLGFSVTIDTSNPQSYLVKLNF